MKKRQNILPCGRVVTFVELGPRDLALKARIKSTLMRETESLEAFSSYQHAGRKRKKWCKNTYNKFVSLLTEKLVDHLMESDRIKTFGDHYWAIGTVASEHYNYANWHTNGAVLGVSIQGLSGNYRMSMSQKRRKELESRINKGQKFHTHERLKAEPVI